MAALKRTIALFLLLAIAGTFAVFCISNRESVTLSLFPLSYTIELPLFLLMLLSFIMGAAAAGIAAGFSSIGRTWELLRSRRRIYALENELGGLKAEKTTLPAQLHD